MNGFSLRTRVAIVVGVVLTVIVSLLLAQMDQMQQRSAMPARSLPVVDVQATIAAADWTIVQLLEPTVPPTATTAVTAAESDAPSTVNASPTAAIVCAAVPTDWIPTVVQPGETLAVLAARTNTSVELLTIVNCLTANELVPGAIIYLPPQEPIAAIDLTGCSPPATWRPVRVSAGSTLSALALRYRTTVFEIMRANCLETTTIYAGRTLYLPPVAFPTAVRPTALPPTLTPTLPPSATPLPSPTSPISGTVVPVTVIPAVTSTAPPTAPPTVSPTTDPAITPSVTSTAAPSATPTLEPTLAPTAVPTTPTPTTPTATVDPSLPTATATPDLPTPTPTAPAASPTVPPTAVPSATPTIQPTAVPTDPPTAVPTTPPTAVPTAAPTAAPTATAEQTTRWPRFAARIRQFGQGS